MFLLRLSNTCSVKLIMNRCLNQPPLLPSCYPKISLVVSRITECTVICPPQKKNPKQTARQEGLERVGGLL